MPGREITGAINNDGSIFAEGIDIAGQQDISGRRWRRLECQRLANRKRVGAVVDQSVAVGARSGKNAPKTANIDVGPRIGQTDLIGEISTIDSPRPGHNVCPSGQQLEIAAVRGDGGAANWFAHGHLDLASRRVKGRGLELWWSDVEDRSSAAKHERVTVLIPSEIV